MSYPCPFYGCPKSEDPYNSVSGLFKHKPNCKFDPQKTPVQKEGYYLCPYDREYLPLHSLFWKDYHLHHFHPEVYNDAKAKADAEGRSMDVDDINNDLFKINITIKPSRVPFISLDKGWDQPVFYSLNPNAKTFHKSNTCGNTKTDTECCKIQDIPNKKMSACTTCFGPLENIDKYPDVIKNYMLHTLIPRKIKPKVAMSREERLHRNKMAKQRARQEKMEELSRSEVIDEI